MLSQFLTIVYNLIINNRWDELKLFLALLDNILLRPSAEITPGHPIEKEP